MCGVPQRRFTGWKRKSGSSTSPPQGVGAGSVQRFLAFMTEDDPYDREIEVAEVERSETRGRHLGRKIVPGFRCAQPRLRSTTPPSRSYAAPAPRAGAAGR